jgi:hypothetical protein
MKNRFIWFCIGFAIACLMLFFIRSCKKPDKPEVIEHTVTTIHIDSFIDTFQKDHIVLKWLKPDKEIVNIPGIIDTQKVIREFYTAKVIPYGYKDSNISLKIIDSVFMNSILKRDMSYEVYRKTILYTTINDNYISPKGIYIGIGATIGAKSGVGIQGAYLKNKSIFSAGFDFINKNVTANYLYKLGK